MPPWLLVDTQPDALDTGVTRDTPVTGVTRDTRIPMGTGKENDAPGVVRVDRRQQASSFHPAARRVRAVRRERTVRRERKCARCCTAQAAFEDGRADRRSLRGRGADLDAGSGAVAGRRPGRAVPAAQDRPETGAPEPGQKESLKLSRPGFLPAAGLRSGCTGRRYSKR